MNDSVVTLILRSAKLIYVLVELLVVLNKINSTFSKTLHNMDS